MKKSLLLLLCFFLLYRVGYSQEHQKDGEANAIVEEVSKRVFKDSKIQLLDIDDAVSEVKGESEKKGNSFKATILKDSTIQSVQGLKEKILKNSDFEKPFNEAGQHPGNKIPDTGFIDTSETDSENLPQISPGNLSTLTGNLAAPSIKELPPIPGSKIKTKYLNHVDSMRKINLSDEKIKLSEKVEGKSKEVVLKEKQSLKDKIYFEGIVGVMGDNIKMVQISPALGYQMLKKYSMGLGPNIELNQGAASFLHPVGLRSFAKYEILKRKIYLQMENVSVPFKEVKEGFNEENIKQKIIKHSLSIGGGYLIQLNKSSSLNLALIYKINKKDALFEGLSPLSFRVGVSTFSRSMRNKL